MVKKVVVKEVESKVKEIKKESVKPVQQAPQAQKLSLEEQIRLMQLQMQAAQARQLPRKAAQLEAIAPATERSSRAAPEEEKRDAPHSYEPRKATYEGRAGTTYTGKATATGLTYEPTKERKEGPTINVLDRHEDNRNARDKPRGPELSSQERSETYTTGLPEEKKKRRDLW